MPGKRPPKGAFSIDSITLADNTFKGAKEEPTQEKTVVRMDST
jgi:hypothetical protein